MVLWWTLSKRSPRNNLTFQLLFEFFFSSPSFFLFSFYFLSFLLFVAPPVSLDGTVAYCAQQPWIRNGALRHNILFGESLNATKYREAIRVCSMEDDIQTITGGNNAEIGERGINLSGGQKARVSLARAVYSNRDIYLLDDILSAVDSHVASHIFEECILKQLKDKTVVLVTHATQFLPQCDRIVVLGGGENAGQVLGIGTFDELVAQGINLEMEGGGDDDKEGEEGEEGKEGEQTLKDGSVTADMRTRSTSSGGLRQRSRTVSGGGGGGGGSNLRTASSSSSRSKSGGGGGGGGDGRLVEEEERATGDVNSSAYWHYLQSMGWWWGVMWVLAGMLQRAAEITMPFVLSLWAAFNVAACQDQYEAMGMNVTFGAIDTDNCTLSIANGSDNRSYMNFYGMVGGLSVLFVTIRGLVTAAARVRASSRIHENLVQSIMAVA